jgi:hypothetical protein
MSLGIMSTKRASTILNNATKDFQKEKAEWVEQNRKAEEAAARFQRLKSLWDRVRCFNTDRMQPDEYGLSAESEEFWTRWAAHIVALAQEMKSQCASDRLDQLEAGESAKSYVLAIFRAGWEGTGNPAEVCRLLKGASAREGTPAHLQGRVNDWIRRDLVPEIMGWKNETAQETLPAEEGDDHGQARTSTLDPDIQTILEKAHVSERIAIEQACANEKAHGRFWRAYQAWRRVSDFRDEAIPKELRGDALYRRYAELIVDLGRVLKADGWQERVDAVTADSAPKRYALTMVRKAMEGDTPTVTLMTREAVNTALQLGVQAISWLSGGLMSEVLQLLPTPEPPSGWEGHFLEPIETVDDFVKWLDGEFLVEEFVHMGRGNMPSDGRRIRNAFRLVVVHNKDAKRPVLCHDKDPSMVTTGGSSKPQRSACRAGPRHCGSVGRDKDGR